LNNWSADVSLPDEWSSLRRVPLTIKSSVEQNSQHTFKGQWLIIDEFNRAPIDLALGEALTALGGNKVLRVPIEGGSAELPIPRKSGCVQYLILLYSTYQSVCRLPAKGFGLIPLP
jgi:hypothetical protein